MKFAVWLGVVLVALVIWLNTPDEVSRYFFYLRVPILVGLLLTGLPLLSVSWLRAMLRNLFVLRGMWQIAFVVTGAVTAGTAVTLVANVILQNAPARFGVPLWIVFPGFWQYVVAVALGLPICITGFVLAREQLDLRDSAVDRRKKINYPVSWTGIAVGVGLGVAWIVLPELKPYISAVALGFPVCMAAYVLSQEQVNGLSEFGIPSRLSRRGHWLGALIGAGISLGMLLLIGLVQNGLATSMEAKQWLIGIISLLTKGSTQGYLDPQGELAAGHLIALAFLLSGLLLYGLIAWFFQPKEKPNRSEAAALLYVMLILSGVVLLLGGMSFYFDYYQILPLLLFLVGSAAIYALFNVNHFYRLVPLPPQDQHSADRLGDFGSVLAKRLQAQTSPKTLVLICASGGGIQAAGWTVEVLAGLQCLLGESFTQATGLISSASGGSVGTMYFLDRFNLKKHCPDDPDLDAIFNSATRDSLDAVGWGLTYPDLCRLIGLPFLVRDPLCDRGKAVEMDWQGELVNKTATLATWREQVIKGEIPIPVFNATLVEDGRRFLISPMSFVQSQAHPSVSSAERQHRFADFNVLYGNYDIATVTAARLSATFPYVSPICRPYVDSPDQSSVNLDGKNYHVADGGYFDNTGVFTVVEWLDNFLKLQEETKQPSPIERIAIVQINAFPKSLPSGATKPGGLTKIIRQLQTSLGLRAQNDTGQGGWTMALLGPLFALFRVRDATQTARNEEEIELLCKRWSGRGVKIKHFPIFFPSFEQIEHVKTKANRSMQRPYFFNAQGKYDPPLSWKLTHAEKEAIKKAWQLIAADSDSEVQKLRQQWIDWGM